jgi:hypothetical protein
VKYDCDAFSATMRVMIATDQHRRQSIAYAVVPGAAWCEPKE